MPQSAAPLSGRGQVHQALGRPHAAIRDFTRAVNADARFAAAYRNRAEAKLEPGAHTLLIEAFNRDGHVALRAHCGALGIATDSNWQSSGDREKWRPVETLDGTPQPLAWSRQQLPVPRAFLDTAPITLSVFATPTRLRNSRMAAGV